MSNDNFTFPALVLVSVDQLKLAFQSWATQNAATESPKNPPESDGELYTKEQLKKLLSIQSDTTIWSMQRSGKLPKPIKIGRRRLWRKTDIDSLIEDSAKPMFANGRK